MGIGQDLIEQTLSCDFFTPNLEVEKLLKNGEKSAGEKLHSLVKTVFYSDSCY